MGPAWLRPVGAARTLLGRVLMLLDDGGVLPGNPSGLFERVALFAGRGWVGPAGLSGVAPGRQWWDRDRRR